MIFTEEHAQMVLEGRKRQTRRPVKPNESFGWARWYETNLKTRAIIIALPDGRTRVKWQEGKVYAIQPGRGKKAVGRIRITKIRRERVQNICIHDLRAEGIPFMWHFEERERAMYERFGELWNSLYRKPYRWEDNPEVWALEFEKVEGR